LSTVKLALNGQWQYLLTFIPIFEQVEFITPNPEKTKTRPTDKLTNE